MQSKGGYPPTCSHLVADLGTDRAGPDPIHQLAGVAVVPVLAHELLLCHRERTQLAVQRLLILKVRAVKCMRKNQHHCLLNIPTRLPVTPPPLQ